MNTSELSSRYRVAVITELRKAGTELKTLTLSGLDPRKLYEPSGFEPAGPVMIWGDTGDVDIDQLKIASSTATLIPTLRTDGIFVAGRCRDQPP